MGPAVTLGGCTVLTKSVLQSIVSLGSGESECYVLVQGAAAGMHVQSLLRDWGVDADVEVLSDSSAARAFASRRGLGHMRRVATRYLLLQEWVCRRELAVKRVGTLDNRSDFLT